MHWKKKYIIAEDMSNRGQRRKENTQTTNIKN
jgi:hypothetical protein